jgi:hypothetical protein
MMGHVAVFAAQVKAGNAGQDLAKFQGIPQREQMKIPALPFKTIVWSGGAAIPSNHAKLFVLD